MFGGELYVREVFDWRFEEFSVCGDRARVQVPGMYE